MRDCLEYDFPRKLFHFFELLPDVAVVGNRLLHLNELLGCERHRDRFLRYFAGPLIPRPSAASRLQPA